MLCYYVNIAKEINGKRTTYINCLTYFYYFYKNVKAYCVLSGYKKKEIKEYFKSSKVIFILLRDDLKI